MVASDPDRAEEDVGFPQDPVAQFEDFFTQYELEKGNFVYKEKIKLMYANNEFSLLIDHLDTLRHNAQFGQMILDDPANMIKKGTQALVNRLHDDYGVLLTSDKYTVRFYNLPSNETFAIHDIPSEKEDKLIAVTGVVVQRGPPKDFVMMASFECKICSAEHDVEQIGDDEFTYPAICNVGGCKNSKKTDFRLKSKNSVKVELCQIRIQENVQELEGKARRPVELDVRLLGDKFIKSIDPQAGDHLRIIGYITNVTLDKETKERRNLGRVMVANQIIHEERQDFKIDITPDALEKIKALSIKPNLMELMGKSLAPEIYGNDFAKRGLMLSLFSRQRLAGIEGKGNRGYVNVILFGDPATGKTVLLKDILNLVFPAVLASGSWATSKGIVGSLIPKEKGGYTFVPGAIVYAFGGILIIDEFDKLSKEDKAALNDALENGIIPIDKGDVHTSVRAEFCCFAAANPKLGRWDDNLTPLENLNLAPYTLDRYGLKFIFKDKPDQTKDRRVAENLASIFMERRSVPKEVLERTTRAIDLQLLRQYIYYANENFKEVYISPEAVEYGCDYYEKIRQSNGTNGAIPFTHRDLANVWRLTIARARMGLRHFATVDDIKEVISIIEESLHQVAYDENSKTFDVDVITFGNKHAVTKAVGDIIKVIRNMEEEGHGALVSEKDLIDRLRFAPLKFTEDKSKELIEKAQNWKCIRVSEKGYIKITMDKADVRNLGRD